ncbi:MAG: hypothetical protein ACK559_04840, partial [bacterium]
MRRFISPRVAPHLVGEDKGAPAHQALELGVGPAPPAGAPRPREGYGAAPARPAWPRARSPSTPRRAAAPGGAVNLRTIALKPGELRPLDRGGLLLLGLRCAARVAPWRPPSAEAPWAAGWALAMAAAVGPPADPAAARALARALADAGARACNALTGADEPLGRAHNYACSTLSTVVEAAAVADRPPLLK